MRAEILSKSNDGSIETEDPLENEDLLENEDPLENEDLLENEDPLVNEDSLAKRAVVMNKRKYYLYKTKTSEISAAIFY